MAIKTILSNTRLSVRQGVAEIPANTDTTVIINLDIPGEANEIKSLPIDYSALSADEKETVDAFVSMILSKNS